MVIQHNISSMNTNRQLNISTENKSKSTERLSSGYRINRAADDTAGLTISEKMRLSIRGLNQASRNIEDGISLTQVADGGMNEIHSILQRQRELSVQAASDTNTAEDRTAIQREMDALSTEITRIANDTSFNTHQVLNHSGNLIYGPVDPNTAVTTLLNQPGSTTNGTMTGFMATNAVGSIQSQLLFGGNNAGTSPFQANVTLGTPPAQISYMYQSGTTNNNCVVTNDTSIPDGIKTTFTYNDGGGNPLFSIERTMTKIPNPASVSGEVYKMDFSFTNHTTEPMSANIEVGMDVMFSGNDNPSFLMDGNNQETIITHSLKYPDAGPIPGVINLFDTNNPYLNVQCIVGGFGATTPDYVKIGNFGNMMGNTWMNNFPIRDSMYTVGWDNIAVAPGGTSNAFTTMFGVSDPMENPVLAGSHRTPPIINIQSSDQARTAITIPLVNCTADNLGVEHLNVSSFAASGASLDAIDHAIDQLSDFRSRMGAVSNRLEKAKNNVDNTGENIQAAESRIRDVDMAKEMVEYSKENILQQAGQSLLAQAAQINEGVLQLLS